MKGEAPFRRGRVAAKQVPELLEQVRDLLEFLPDLFRRAAVPAFLRFLTVYVKNGTFLIVRRAPWRRCSDMGTATVEKNAFSRPSRTLFHPLSLHDKRRFGAAEKLASVRPDSASLRPAAARCGRGEGAVVAYFIQKCALFFTFPWDVNNKCLNLREIFPMSSRNDRLDGLSLSAFWGTARREGAGSSRRFAPFVRRSDAPPTRIDAASPPHRMPRLVPRQGRASHRAPAPWRLPSAVSSRCARRP